jgi:hypothetical protein
MLAIVGVLAAGCGDDAAGGANSPADSESKARDAALKHAQCMREHGVDMPDPSFEAGGIRQAGPEDVPPAKLAEAEKACEKHLDAIEPPELSEEEQEEFEKAALAHARCMREQGIENFPDPTFGGNGEARIRLGGVDPEDPGFQEAEEACEDTRAKPPSAESAP